MPGLAIKPQVLTELQRQFNYELAAAHAYLAMAIWCDQQNLKGFAQFFSKQAAEEREHAQKIIRHILDRGESPMLASVPAPKGAWPSILDVAKQAQSMEAANTQGCNAVYAAAVATQDFPAQVLMQWFITEQVEEEAWTDELVDRVQRANCAGGMGELDRHLERHLEGEGVNAAAGEKE